MIARSPEMSLARLAVGKRNFERAAIRYVRAQGLLSLVELDVSTKYPCVFPAHLLTPLCLGQFVRVGNATPRVYNVGR